MVRVANFQNGLREMMGHKGALESQSSHSSSNSDLKEHLDEYLKNEHPEEDFQLTFPDPELGTSLNSMPQSNKTTNSFEVTPEPISLEVSKYEGLQLQISLPTITKIENIYKHESQHTPYEDESNNADFERKLEVKTSYFPSSPSPFAIDTRTREDYHIYENRRDKFAPRCLVQEEKEERANRKLERDIMPDSANEKYSIRRIGEEYFSSHTSNGPTQREKEEMKERVEERKIEQMEMAQEGCRWNEYVKQAKPREIEEAVTYFKTREVEKQKKKESSWWRRACRQFGIKFKTSKSMIDQIMMEAARTGKLPGEVMSRIAINRWNAARNPNQEAAPDGVNSQPTSSGQESMDMAAWMDKEARSGGGGDSKGDMSRRHEFGPPAVNDSAVQLDLMFKLYNDDIAFPDGEKMTYQSLFRFLYKTVGDFNTNRSPADSVVLMHPQFVGDCLEAIKGSYHVTPEQLITLYGCYMENSAQIRRAVVPVFRNGHFLLVHYGRDENDVVHAHVIDSMLTKPSGPDSPYLTNDEAQLIGGELFNVSPLEVQPSRAKEDQIPYQNNDYDCGPHTILSTEACLKDDRFISDITRLSQTRNQEGESITAVRERAMKVVREMYEEESEQERQRNACSSNGTINENATGEEACSSVGKLDESGEKIDDSIEIVEEEAELDPINENELNSEGHMSRRHEFGPPVENDSAVQIELMCMLSDDDIVFPDRVQMTQTALFRFLYESVGDFNTKRSPAVSVVLMYPVFAEACLKAIENQANRNPETQTPEHLVRCYGCFMDSSAQIQRAVVPVYRAYHFLLVHYGRDENDVVHAHVMDSKHPEPSGPNSPYLTDHEAQLIGGRLFNVSPRKVRPSRANRDQIPYQDNDYDCGPHTILSTEACLKDNRFISDITHLSDTRNTFGESMTDVRERVMKDVRAMYKEQKKQASRSNTVPRTFQQHNSGSNDGTMDENATLEAPALQTTSNSNASSSNDKRNLVLHSIFYNGRNLRLPSDESHIPNVVFGILQKIFTTIEQSVSDSRAGWVGPKNPNKATIMECIRMYNTIAKRFAINWSGSYNTKILGQWGKQDCTADVAIDITTYAYQCAVPEPSVLNRHYKSFSSEVYGEITTMQMKSIIDELGIGSQDVFVDLGSGIGQLICFTAAYAKCQKCVGIELSDKPAEFGSKIAEYFKKLINFFGKNYGSYELFHGDMRDPQFKTLICEEATVIVLNNLLFSSKLKQDIEDKLLKELKDGTRIISTAPFDYYKKQITLRSVNHLSAISHTKLLQSLEDGFSWTDKAVQIYCTTIDHTKLKNFHLEQDRKRKLSKAERRREEFEKAPKKSKKSKTSSRQDVSEVDAPRTDAAHNTKNINPEVVDITEDDVEDDTIDITPASVPAETSSRQNTEEVETPRAEAGDKTRQREEIPVGGEKATIVDVDDDDDDDDDENDDNDDNDDDLVEYDPANTCAELLTNQDFVDDDIIDITPASVPAETSSRQNVEEVVTPRAEAVNETGQREEIPVGGEEVTVVDVDDSDDDDDDNDDNDDDLVVCDPANTCGELLTNQNFVKELAAVFGKMKDNTFDKA